jgi:hypothetical protein
MPAHALAAVVWTLRLAHALGNDSSAAVYVQDAEPAWKRRASNDLLSDLLRLVRLTGALMFEVGVRGWWGFVDDPTIGKFATAPPTGTHHLISLNAVIEGRCRVCRAPDNWTAVPEGHAVGHRRPGPARTLRSTGPRGGESCRQDAARSKWPAHQISIAPGVSQRLRVAARQRERGRTAINVGALARSSRRAQRLCCNCCNSALQRALRDFVTRPGRRLSNTVKVIADRPSISKLGAIERLVEFLESVLCR